MSIVFLILSFFLGSICGFVCLSLLICASTKKPRETFLENDHSNDYVP